MKAVMMVHWPRKERVIHISRGGKTRDIVVSKAGGMAFLGACYHRAVCGIGKIEFHYSHGDWLYTEDE